MPVFFTGPQEAKRFYTPSFASQIFMSVCCMVGDFVIDLLKE